jgi:hypothetical protein
LVKNFGGYEPLFQILKSMRQWYGSGDRGHTSMGSTIDVGMRQPAEQRCQSHLQDQRERFGQGQGKMMGEPLLCGRGAANAGVQVMHKAQVRLEARESSIGIEIEIAIEIEIDSVQVCASVGLDTDTDTVSIPIPFRCRFRFRFRFQVGACPNLGFLHNRLIFC